MARSGILRNRNFAILFSGQVVSKLGNNLYLLALPWYVYTVTGSKSALAITGFFQSIPIVLGLFTGVFVDRWHKRTTLIVVDALRVIISLALFVSVITHAHLWVVIVLVLLLESVGRFYNPASVSLLPLVVASEDIVAAEGLSQSGGATAQLIALFSGGVLMQVAGPALLFLGNGITFALSMLSFIFIRVDETLQRSQSRSFLREWVDGLKLSVKSRRILVMLSAAMIANFAFAAFDIVTTAWIKGPVHGNALTLGLFGGLFFAGVILGGILLGFVNRRLSVLAILTGGLIVTGVLVSVLGLFPKLWWMLPLVCVMGLANGLLNGSLGASFVTVVPEHMRGRIFGTLNALGAIMTPVGMAVYGWLMTLVPLDVIFILIGVPVILGGVSLFIPTSDDTNQLAQVSV